MLPDGIGSKGGRAEGTADGWADGEDGGRVLRRLRFGVKAVTAESTFARSGLYLFRAIGTSLSRGLGGRDPDFRAEMFNVFRHGRLCSLLEGLQAGLYEFLSNLLCAVSADMFDHRVLEIRPLL